MTSFLCSLVVTYYQVKLFLEMLLDLKVRTTLSTQRRTLDSLCINSRVCVSIVKMLYPQHKGYEERFPSDL